MSIFFKMLVAPVLSLCLYTGFLVYTWFGYFEGTERLQAIRDEFLPAARLAGENLRLFEEFREVYKDAVSAGERDWIPEAVAVKSRLDNNIEKLRGYPLIVDDEQLDAIQDSVHRYHDNAKALALTLLERNGGIGEDDLIRQVERAHNESIGGLERLDADIEARFSDTVEETIARLDHLLFVGSIMTVGLLLVVAAVSLYLSAQTRASLLSVIGGIKALARKETDFSARLDTGDRGELGSLIHWFNRLSEKLESDYKAMEQVAVTDKLTGLNNRVRSDAYLSDLLDRDAVGVSTLSVILFDLDHFKSVNDCFGHLVGDSVLERLASLLKHWAAKGEFIARWGGEEFIVVLPGVNEQDALLRAESLRNTIEHGDFPVIGTLTASFGVTGARRGESVVEVMKRVDACLYLAKQRGRNLTVAANAPSSALEQVSEPESSSG